ncbi:hypothetical protein [Runella slithyformis]|uniref:Uncharacterized protein n=1 Tax=Runella slithyformis (strain ATCC 29530 / DSM 19594 / LMG 11500 / NCIMB 11436 / LSU 4) TaxID=761193 RepID=A0A7U3ZNW0_RUNSL|nr:hypothetical protein [Runella slithyformis]AEI50652.1 hypothetical protein Runsl_4314 [Runella slithyformis DSM 19594]
MEWKKTARAAFKLVDNDNVVGLLNMEPTAVTWEMGGMTYRFQQKSSWKQTYQFINPEGALIGEMRPKNWYGTTFVITLEEQSFYLTFTNNPLAAVQLRDAENQWLIQARLMTANHQVQTEFSMKEAFKDAPNAYWLAGIIWNYFYPMAQSECGDIDAATFLLLATA